MAIKIMSPTIEEFDPEAAIAEWMTSTPSGQKRQVGERIKQPARPKQVITLADSDLDQADEMDQADEVTDTSSQSTSEIQSTTTSLVPEKMMYDGDDSDGESDCEMSEDLVFSLLMEYSRD